MLRLFVLISITACVLGEVVPQSDGRIVGGMKTTIEEFPHQISLNWKGRHICGGSIIKETVIVTAAHCVVGKWPQELQVQAGSTRLSGRGVRIGVIQIISHEHYFPLIYHNDIALVILAEPLKFSKSIWPIPLPKYGEEAKNGATAYASGWGKLSNNGSYPDVLRYVGVYIMDSHECQDYMYGLIISENMICAGVRGAENGICFGDSGGPLISDGKLVGIVSWSTNCGDHYLPDGYTSVSYLRKWIDSKLGK